LSSASLLFFFARHFVDVQALATSVHTSPLGEGTTLAILSSIHLSAVIQSKPTRAACYKLFPAFTSVPIVQRPASKLAAHSSQLTARPFAAPLSFRLFLPHLISRNRYFRSSLSHSILHRNLPPATTRPGSTADSLFSVLSKRAHIHDGAAACIHPSVDSTIGVPAYASPAPNARFALFPTNSSRVAAEGTNERREQRDPAILGPSTRRVFLSGSPSCCCC
jgi:hypothetical protein